ncbi:hypothetical protein FOCC_FOCC017564 [Frankliniella occidentalis]|nr:hypothetical protein FOCC_FOCC017564 [Frankliniella occidentalis]
MAVLVHVHGAADVNGLVLRRLEVLPQQRTRLRELLQGDVTCKEKQTARCTSSKPDIFDIMAGGRDFIEDFNRLNDPPPLLAVRDIELGQRFVVTEMHNMNAPFESVLYANLEDVNGQSKRLVLPHRYSSQFSRRDLVQIYNNIEEDRPPTIIAIRKRGTGFDFGIFPYGQEPAV